VNNNISNNKSENRELWETMAQRVYEASDLNQLAIIYDEWAAGYEKDINEVFGNYSPKRTVDTFIQFLTPEARILDVGAGTGLVGEVLYDYGYRNIEALELSQGMLTEARKKGVYTALHQMALGDYLSIETASYDAIIAKGVMGPGHAPAKSFYELVRITKPGGYIAFTIRTDFYPNSEYEAKANSLEERNLWTLVEKTEEFNCWPKATKEIFYNVWVYQRL